MLAKSSIRPGAILWLPKQDELSLSFNDPITTVPSRCFGHPVLVLATNLSKSSATILIVSRASQVIQHTNHT